MRDEEGGKRILGMVDGNAAELESRDGSSGRVDSLERGARVRPGRPPEIVGITVCGIIVEELDKGRSAATDEDAIELVPFPFINPFPYPFILIP